MRARAPPAPLPPVQPAASRPRVTIPFSAKLTALFVGLAIGPMTLVGWLAYGHSLETGRQHLELLVQGIAEQAAQEPDRGVAEMFGMLRSWTTLSLMQEIVTDDTDAKISAFL